ncbi:hypothetical protein ACEZCY_32640 [Streptacidiphilus sp. N1-12]|uniref:Uncharacterized protein n=2 Tax=Streptacidiphilus alkalitolerans TaxID=3342712 RepID=A0ABV6VJI2_9ACTN
MNVIRLVTAAAAGTALLTAAAPAAHALDYTQALGGAAKTTGVAARTAVPVAEGVLGDKVGQKVEAVQKTVKAGTDAVAGVNELVG